MIVVPAGPGMILKSDSKDRELGIEGGVLKQISDRAPRTSLPSSVTRRPDVAACDANFKYIVY